MRWPLLDQGALRQLAQDVGADGAIEVARLFLAEAPNVIQRLELARGFALLREVHSLASAAHSLGLLRLGYAAAEIERMIASKEPGAESVTELRGLLRASVAVLADWEATRSRC